MSAGGLAVQSGRSSRGDIWLDKFSELVETVVGVSSHRNVPHMCQFHLLMACDFQRTHIHALVVTRIPHRFLIVNTRNAPML